MAKFKRRGKKIETKHAFDFIGDELKLLGDWHVKRRNDVVSPWTGKPIFSRIVRRTTKGWNLSVFMTGEHAIKWTVMDQGDPGRMIDATNPSGFMTFLSGYIASTTKGTTVTKQASRFGDTVKAKSVEHSVEPRGINDIINELSKRQEASTIAKQSPKF